RSGFGIDLAGDLAFANDEEAVGECRHLFEFGGDEEYRRTGIAKFDEFAVDEFDSADIDAACGLRDEQQPRLKLELASDDEFLLIAARKRAGGQFGIRRPHVKILDDISNAFFDRRTADKSCRSDR